MFKAYFQSTVHEKWKSPFQIRIVNISFFLEDGTMKISEPATENSGIEQGFRVHFKIKFFISQNNWKILFFLYRKLSIWLLIK